MAQNFVKKTGTVMPHGVCKGTPAPTPKVVIKKEVSVKKTGVAGK